MCDAIHRMLFLKRKYWYFRPIIKTGFSVFRGVEGTFRRATFASFFISSNFSHKKNSSLSHSLPYLQVHNLLLLPEECQPNVVQIYN
jgi:hypothetical protein